MSTKFLLISLTPAVLREDAALCEAPGALPKATRDEAHREAGP